MYEIISRPNAIEHYKLITPNEIIYFEPSVTKMCVENLLVGWNELSYSHNQQDLSLHQVKAFRRRALKYIGKSSVARSTSCDVLLVLKNVTIADHKYQIGNVPELMEGLEIYEAEAVLWLRPTRAEIHPVLKQALGGAVGLAQFIDPSAIGNQLPVVALKIEPAAVGLKCSVETFRPDIIK